VDEVGEPVGEPSRRCGRPVMGRRREVDGGADGGVGRRWKLERFCWFDSAGDCGRLLCSAARAWSWCRRSSPPVSASCGRAWAAPSRRLAGSPRNPTRHPGAGPDTPPGRRRARRPSLRMRLGTGGATVGMSTEAAGRAGRPSIWGSRRRGRARGPGRPSIKGARISSGRRAHRRSGRGEAGAAEAPAGAAVGSIRGLA
jgi:hypothetical protein